MTAPKLDAMMPPDTLRVETRLQNAVDAGEMLEDAAQAQLAQALDALADRCVSAQAAAPQKRRFWRAEKKTTPQGLYIRGDVGRGKTLLCDWFIEAYSQDLPMERLHFHGFMEQIHAQIRALGAVEDPLPKIAKAWAARARVLVLDEMQVNDITDAMIMNGLFRSLIMDGMVLLTTSNLAPDELYAGGLQRARFLPCIALLETHCQVFALGDGEDYRRRTLTEGGVSFVGEAAAVTAQLDERYQVLSGQAVTPASLSVFGRPIALRAEHGDIAYFEFDKLCGSGRSVKDYIELASLYGTLILGPCTPMSDQDLDLLRRFINLIDALYDHGTKLVLGSTVPLSELYSAERLAFPYARCLSRLIEMQSAQYLHRRHRS